MNLSTTSTARCWRRSSREVRQSLLVAPATRTTRTCGRRWACWPPPSWSPTCSPRPLFGLLAERWPRWKLIAVGIALWSLASGASGLAATFTVLLGDALLRGHRRRGLRARSPRRSSPTISPWPSAGGSSPGSTWPFRSAAPGLCPGRISSPICDLARRELALGVLRGGHPGTALGAGVAPHARAAARGAEDVSRPPAALPGTTTASWPARRPTCSTPWA